MEIIRALWVFIFFFFALILMFTWSKINIIAAKIRAITAVLNDAEQTGSGRQNPETNRDRSGGE